MIEKCLDLKIIDFRQQMNNVISSCGLDAGIVYYIMKDIFYEVEKQYKDIVQKEYQEWELLNQQFLKEEEE